VSFAFLKHAFYFVKHFAVFRCTSLVRVPSIGLANLVSGSRGAPELIQGEVNAARIAAELAKLLTDEGAREAQLRAFASIPERLGGPGSAERAAQALVDFVARGPRA